MFILNMPVDFEADLVPEKQSTESEVDANDSPKEPMERENRNEIEENITVFIID